jgi:hypothetical protein
MVLEFTATSAKSGTITTNGVSLNRAHGKVYSIQHFVKKFVDYDIFSTLDN